MNKKLLIASPCKGNVPQHYMILFQKLVQGGLPGWDVEFLLEGAQNALNISRNILAHEAMKRADRMLMLDTDHPIDIIHLARILSHEVPIVSGLYAIKKPGDPFFLGIRAKGAQPDANGLLEAHFLPTGFLSVSVEALRQIAAYHPEREFYVQQEGSKPAAILPTPQATKETMFEFFPIGVNGPRTASARLRKIRKIAEPIIKKGGLGFFPKHQVQEKLAAIINALTEEQAPGYLTGEDYFFSLLAYQAGVKQYLDVKCTIPHRGAIDFPIVDASVIATKCDPIPEHEGSLEEW